MRRMPNSWIVWPGVPEFREPSRNGGTDIEVPVEPSPLLVSETAAAEVMAAAHERVEMSRRLGEIAVDVA